LERIWDKPFFGSRPCKKKERDYSNVLSGF
jgi:hypothetical protein